MQSRALGPHPRAPVSPIDKQGDLEQGRQVGIYDISAPIGEGGMGDEWRRKVPLEK